MYVETVFHAWVSKQGIWQCNPCEQTQALSCDSLVLALQSKVMTLHNTTPKLLCSSACLLQIELQYGFLYDSYHIKFYYWESVFLLEKFALVVCVSMLATFSQPLQVLVAMAVITLAAVLQVSQRLMVFLLHFMICHSDKCHRPRMVTW